MPNGIPQSYLSATRGMVGNGSPIRNRGQEQAYSGSGNPNMPFFNTSRAAMAGMPAPQAAGGLATMAPPQNPPQFNTQTPMPVRGAPVNGVGNMPIFASPQGMPQQGAPQQMGGAAPGQANGGHYDPFTGTYSGGTPQVNPAIAKWAAARAAHPRPAVQPTPPTVSGGTPLPSFSSSTYSNQQPYYPTVPNSTY